MEYSFYNIVVTENMQQQQRKVDGLPKVFLLKIHIALEQLNLAGRRDCLHRHFQMALSRATCCFQLWHGSKIKARLSHENPARACGTAPERRDTRATFVSRGCSHACCLPVKGALFVDSNLLVPGSDGCVIYGHWQNEPVCGLSSALIKRRHRLPSRGPFHGSWEDSNPCKSHKGGQIHLTDCMMPELMVRKRAIIAASLAGCFKELLLTAWMWKQKQRTPQHTTSKAGAWLMCWAFPGSILQGWISDI